MDIKLSDFLPVLGFILGSGVILGSFKWAGRHVIRDVMEAPLTELITVVKSIDHKADQSAEMASASLTESKLVRQELRDHMSEEEDALKKEQELQKAHRMETRADINNLKENQTRTHQRLDLILQSQGQQRRRRFF